MTLTDVRKQAKENSFYDDSVRILYKDSSISVLAE